MDAIDLRNKNILVTGGSLGIGFATAERCLNAGAKVVLCARNRRNIKNALERLDQVGHKSILGVPADVSIPEDVKTVFDVLEKRLGRVHAVIHAAGIYGPIGCIASSHPSDWLKNIQINLYGSYLVLRESCRRMIKNGGGRILLLAGGGAGSPFPNYTAYAASKVAIVRLAESVAQEMASKQIEINCLAPGFVVTRLHQETLKAGKRAGEVFLKKTRAEIKKGGFPIQKVAEAAAFLVSDQAHGISGKFIAAPYDQWGEWPLHLQELSRSDIFTLRRILPKDRGMDWQ